MMKAFCAATAMTIAGSSMAAGNAEKAPTIHRYLIERTFPAGAIDGVDAAAKRKVNANNSTLDVTWEKSYANADKTKTYCVYTGPSETAVRDAAKLSGLPVDSVVEIPSVQEGPAGAIQWTAVGNQRYLVKRASSAQVNGAKDAAFGVKLLTSYGTADKRDSFWVYEAPSFSAVESAARASGAPFESIAEIPETLYPN
ncbi:MAG: DUF4242 domain-containing protein [Steroidobacteraceae bacterium]|nr:DUF4242 domain-containing protein [Steroidobacteraceae bacterium]